MMRCSFFPSSSQKSSLSDPSRSSSDEIKLLLSLLTFDPCTGSCLHWICPFVPQKIIKKDEERKSWKTNAKTGTARYFEVQCSVERNRVVWAHQPMSANISSKTASSNKSKPYKCHVAGR
jgi:hypothetical protein